MNEEPKQTVFVLFDGPQLLGIYTTYKAAEKGAVDSELSDWKVFPHELRE